MVKKIEALDQIIDKGIDIRNRRIYFGNIGDGEDGSEFAWDSVERAIRAIHVLASANKQPIEIYMNSGGGSSIDMMRMYDEILACPCKVVFVGGGQISSSATWIMSACDERYLHKNTMVLLHDGNSSSDGNHTDFLIDASWAENHMDDLYRMYESNSRMSFDFWADVCQRDVILTAEEAVLFGLADKIIEPLKRGNLRRSRINSMKKMPEDKVMKALVKDVYRRTRRRRNLNKIDISLPVEQYDDSVIEIEELTNEDFMPNGVVEEGSDK